MKDYVPITHARGASGALCGAASRVVAFGNPSGRVDCKRCLAALARQKANAARSNTESSAGRIPRTPGR